MFKQNVIFAHKAICKTIRTNTNIAKNRDIKNYQTRTADSVFRDVIKINSKFNTHKVIQYHINLLLQTLRKYNSLNEFKTIRESRNNIQKTQRQVPLYLYEF